MTSHGDVLLADDEETFRESTADLLRQQGYRCDAAADAAAADQMLRAAQYHVLIADIHMPGNAGLEFVTRVQETAAGMPVILVTGYPSFASAVASVHLPVMGYLVKPFDFDELLVLVRTGVQRSETHRTICDARRRLGNLDEELHQLENMVRDSARLFTPESADAFTIATIESLIKSLSDLHRLVGVLGITRERVQPCETRDLAVELERTNAALREAVQVLEESKSAFKSKRLGQLRRQLEDLVNRRGDREAK